jgi:hypothetical protein
MNVNLKQKPLPRELPGLDKYEWSTHSIQRMQERNVSPFEAVACMTDPDICYPSETDHSVMKYRRGDVSVAYSPKDNLIVTVSVRDETLDREPLVPKAEGETMSRVEKMTAQSALLAHMQNQVPGVEFLIADVAEKYHENLEANYGTITTKRAKSNIAAAASYFKGLGKLTKTVNGYAVTVPAGAVELATQQPEEVSVPTDTELDEQPTVGVDLTHDPFTAIEEAESMEIALAVVEVAEGVLVPPVQPPSDLSPRRKVQAAVTALVEALRLTGVDDFSIMENGKEFTIEGKFPPHE